MRKHILPFALLAIPLVVLGGWALRHALAPPEEVLLRRLSTALDAVNSEEPWDLGEGLGRHFRVEPDGLDVNGLADVVWHAMHESTPLRVALHGDSLHIAPREDGTEVFDVRLTVAVRTAGAAADIDPYLVHVEATARDRGRGLEFERAEWSGEGEVPFDTSGLSVGSSATLPLSIRALGTFSGSVSTP